MVDLSEALSFRSSDRMAEFKTEGVTGSRRRTVATIRLNGRNWTESGITSTQTAMLLRVGGRLVASGITSTLAVRCKLDG